MIIAYLDDKKFTRTEINTTNQELLKDAIWVDLFTPSKEEETLVENCFGLEIPTRAEMAEIEVSSRLYKENDFLFMTATVLAQSTSSPVLDPVTCILTHKQFITLRYVEPQCYPVFLTYLKKIQDLNRTAFNLFLEFLDANVDSLADTLELVAHRLDTYSKTIFQSQTENASPPRDYRQLMQQIGGNGELNTKTRESLLTFNRLISFFTQMTSAKMDNEERIRLSVLSNDILALSDHSNFMSNKVIFLLEATLGMVSIEQNNIIKIFSVAAVIFLPPTLIASIYGMNFHFIPEFSWKYGYLFAIGVMVFSAWLPYKYFKSRKWL